MLIYSLLHLTGYASPTMDDIRQFRQLGSPCAGHPENFLIDGVEATTGPLGQGLAMAVGMAIAERHLNAVFGSDLVEHKTWVIAGDGCLMEGVNHEAIGLAGHLGLGNLIVLWDDNKVTIDGHTDLSTSEDIPARYRATGWHTAECDGHDVADVRRALAEAAADPRPSLVQCRTVIGKGRAQQAGHFGGARQSARRRRDRRGARVSRLDRRAIRRARRHSRRLALARREGRRSQPRVAGPPRRLGAARRVREPVRTGR
jgi:transketolase